jgi:putative alpha-1,2-mannosidase
VIETRNRSEENIYIHSITLNGKEVKDPWISFREIVKGGKLVFEMGPEKVHL